MTTTSDVSTAKTDHNDAEYDAFLSMVSARFQTNVRELKTPLFTTDAEGLFQAYLNGLPAENRQHHNCRACEHFMTRFGGLVTITPEGALLPAVWNEYDAPLFYRPAIAAVIKLILRAKVNGVFVSSEQTLGQPSSRTETTTWHHFSTVLPRAMVYKRTTLTAGQAAAEKLEDFKTVDRALHEFTPAMVTQALTLLRTDSLYRSEKVLGQAVWLDKLHTARVAVPRDHRDNVLWLAVGTAPAGFCHPRASMIGTLLEDLKAGMDFAEVSRRFADKMHPLSYQRPQAAPSAGVIAQAEKVIAQLDAAGSLSRRFARMEDIGKNWLWKPREPKEAEASNAGVFGHLKPKGSERTAKQSIDMPVITMTWDKFSKTVLPNADQIEFYAKSVRDSYVTLVTAANADAPPILQWDPIVHSDGTEERNPVSWYFWHLGCTPEEFNLTSGKYHKVSLVTLVPSMWSGRAGHREEAVFFIIEGARDGRREKGVVGNCLFPENMKTEFHGIRSVIEAYSRQAVIGGVEGPMLCGIAMSKDKGDRLFRVTTNGVSVEYKLDRWD